jgi:tetratricopeptide (TPR) repeat protein
MKRVRMLLIFLSVIGGVLLAGAQKAGADAYTQALEVLAVGDTQKAIKLFSQAITANPDEFHIYNDRGVAYKISGNPENALADYTKALELKPDYANALNNRGVIYLQKGLYDEAIEDFTGALKSTALKSKVHTNLGLAYAQKGKHKQAVEHLEAALSFRPLDHRAFLFMAESLEQLQEYEKAGKMYQLSVGLAKDSSTADMIEKRIAQVERNISKSGSRKSNIDEGRNQFSGSSEPRGTSGHVKKSSDTSSNAPNNLQERPTPGISLNQTRTRQSSGNPFEAIYLLEKNCRSRLLDKLSPAAAEIYKQGVQFLEKAQPRQALIRFEDILQLEKRNRNTAAVALSSLALGRTYLKMGDYVTAGAKFQDALRIFRQLNASDETILTLLEIAGAKKAAGQKDKASEVYVLAKERAMVRGDGQLAQAISDLESGKTIPAPNRTAAAIRDTMARSQRIPSDQKVSSRTKGEGQTQPPPATLIARKDDKESKITPVPSDINKQKHMGNAGHEPEPKPVASKMTVVPASPVENSSLREPRKKSETRPHRLIPAKNRATAGDKPVHIETAVGGQQIVTKEKQGAQAPAELSGVNLEEQNFSATKKSQRGIRQGSWDSRVKDNLIELRKYRNLNDETNMILALENLAEIYSSHNQYDKAVHSLVAAIAYREKLNLNKGLDKLYVKRGLMREKLGNSAGALADLTRALFYFDGRESLSSKRALESRIRKIASAINLDPPAAMGAYQTLWRARSRTDDRAETHALYTIGKLYDRADKNEEALSYYDQSSASILADKARVYEKIGQKTLAAQSYKSALEAFRKLDYSRYLSLLKKTESR